MLDHRVQSGEGYVNARTQGTVKGMCYIGNNYSTPLGRPYWDCNVHQPECMTHTYGTECMTHTYGTECMTHTYGTEFMTHTYGTECMTHTYGTECMTHTYGTEFMTHTYGTECMTHIYGTEVGEPWWVLVVDDFPDEQQLKAAPWYTCKGFRVFGQEGG